MGKKIDYTNGELTIIWQPNVCVFISLQIENATTAELIAQINQCPSGALTYRMNKEVK